MGLRFRPRSIRGKLVVTFLLALGPILCIQAFHYFYACKMELDTPTPLRGQMDWILASIAASVLGLGIVFAMGNRLSHPIRRLALAASAVAAGDYRKRVKIRTGDEIELLGDSFNSLGESLSNHDAAAKKQAEMLAGMVEAARVASSSLNLRECGRAIAKAMCTHLGAVGAAVFYKNPVEGGMEIVGHSGKRQTASWKRLAQHASDSRGYLVIAERTSDAQAEALLTGIPLCAVGRSHGAIVARFQDNVTRENLRLGSEKAEVLAAFGIHAAEAIINAETYLRTEKYSEVLEDWVEHLSSVMQVTDAISPSLNLGEALRDLTRATACVFGADLCGIFLPDRNGNLKAAGCWSHDGRSLSGVVIEPGYGVTGQAFAEKRTTACFDVSKQSNSRFQAAYKHWDTRGILSTPLIVEDRAIGVISICSREPRRFTPQEIHILTSIGLHAAVLVRNAGLYTKESAIAEALQKDLVPQVPDECRGLKFASRYIPAFDEARVGGDFYNVSVLPNGKVGVIMADVSGKGLRAAIHLAACKYMGQALMYEHPDDPGLVLCKLNNALNYYFDASFFVTAFYGVIDPAGGTVLYANAGHPPPLLITEQRKIHTCLSETGTPLGSGYPCRYETRSVKTQPSDLLLLYTDGVIEASVDGEWLGIDDLHRIVFETGGCSPSELIERICSRLEHGSTSPQRDDIALLAILFNDAPAASRTAIGGSVEQEHRITA